MQIHGYQLNLHNWNKECESFLTLWKSTLFKTGLESSHLQSVYSAQAMQIVTNYAPRVSNVLQLNKKNLKVLLLKKTLGLYVHLYN